MAFRGWPTEALEFYEGLEADNSKTYWTAHKAVYEEKVYAPMVALLAELEPRVRRRAHLPSRTGTSGSAPTSRRTRPSIAATLERGGYVQLTAHGLGAGCGTYQTVVGELARYRGRGGRREDRRRAGPDHRHGSSRPGSRSPGTSRCGPCRGGSRRTTPGPICCATRVWSPGGSGRPGPWLGKASAKDRVVELLRASKPLTGWLATNVHRDDDDAPSRR